MKFTVTLKDPDGPYDSITEAAEDSISEIEGLSEREVSQLATERAEELREFTEQWLEYGEYARIEFDTEAKTATLKKAR